MRSLGLCLALSVGAAFVWAGEHPEHPMPKKKEAPAAQEHPAGQKEHPAGQKEHPAAKSDPSAAKHEHPAGHAEGHDHAKEHPREAKEHPEHPAKQAQAAPPSQADIQKLYAGIVSRHVQEASKGGSYKVRDENSGKDRMLGLTRIHKHKIVMLSDDEAFACSDFKTVKGGKDKLDVDFYVRRSPEGWKVSEVLIHKVNGKERFTYNENNERVPVQ